MGKLSNLRPDLDYFIKIKAVTENYTLLKEDHNHLLDISNSISLTLPNLNINFFTILKTEPTNTITLVTNYYTLVPNFPTLTGYSSYLLFAINNNIYIFKSLSLEDLNLAIEDIFNQKFSSSDAIAEGETNKYFTEDLFLSYLSNNLASTDDLPEGEVNLYYTEDKVTTLLSGTFTEIDTTLETIKDNNTLINSFINESNQLITDFKNILSSALPTVRTTSPYLLMISDDVDLASFTFTVTNLSNQPLFTVTPSVEESITLNKTVYSFDLTNVMGSLLKPDKYYKLYKENGLIFFLKFLVLRDRFLNLRDLTINLKESSPTFWELSITSDYPYSYIFLDSFLFNYDSALSSSNYLYKLEVSRLTYLPNSNHYIKGILDLNKETLPFVFPDLDFNLQLNDNLVKVLYGTTLATITGTYNLTGEINLETTTINFDTQTLPITDSYFDYSTFRITFDTSSLTITSEILGGFNLTIGENNLTHSVTFSVTKEIPTDVFYVTIDLLTEDETYWYLRGTYSPENSILTIEDDLGNFIISTESIEAIEKLNGFWSVQIQKTFHRSSLLLLISSSSASYPGLTPEDSIVIPSYFDSLTFQNTRTKINLINEVSYTIDVLYSTTDLPTSAEININGQLFTPLTFSNSSFSKTVYTSEPCFTVGTFSVTVTVLTNRGGSFSNSYNLTVVNDNSLAFINKLLYKITLSVSEYNNKFLIAGLYVPYPSPFPAEGFYGIESKAEYVTGNVFYGGVWGDIGFQTRDDVWYSLIDKNTVLNNSISSYSYFRNYDIPYIVKVFNEQRYLTEGTSVRPAVILDNYRLEADINGDYNLVTSTTVNFGEPLTLEGDILSYGYGLDTAFLELNGTFYPVTITINDPRITITTIDPIELEPIMEYVGVLWLGKKKVTNPTGFWDLYNNIEIPYKVNVIKPYDLPTIRANNKSTIEGTEYVVIRNIQNEITGSYTLDVRDSIQDFTVTFDNTTENITNVNTVTNTFSFNLDILYYGYYEASLYLATDPTRTVTKNINIVKSDALFSNLFFNIPQAYQNPSDITYHNYYIDPILFLSISDIILKIYIDDSIYSLFPNGIECQTAGNFIFYNLLEISKFKKYYRIDYYGEVQLITEELVNIQNFIVTRVDNLITIQIPISEELINSLNVVRYYGSSDYVIWEGLNANYPNSLKIKIKTLDVIRTVTYTDINIFNSFTLFVSMLDTSLNDNLDFSITLEENINNTITNASVFINEYDKNNNIISNNKILTSYIENKTIHYSINKNNIEINTYYAFCYLNITLDNNKSLENKEIRRFNILRNIQLNLDNSTVIFNEYPGTYYVTFTGTMSGETSYVTVIKLINDLRDIGIDHNNYFVANIVGNTFSIDVPYNSEFYYEGTFNCKVIAYLDDYYENQIEITQTVIRNY